MGKAVHLTPTKRAQIVAYKNCGMTERQIAKKLKRSKTAIHNALLNFKERASYKDKPYGATRKTTSRQDRAVMRLVKDNSFISSNTACTKFMDDGAEVSSRTVRRRLCENGLKSYKVAKKPLLNATMKRKRFEFALNYRDWTSQDWSKVL